MMPSCDQTGVPIHFHSSTTSGSASLISLRILLRVSPRQSPSPAILFEMSSDADWPSLAPDFFMFSSWKFQIYFICMTVEDSHARSGHQQLRLAVIGWSRLPFTDVRPRPSGRHPIEQGAILARPRGRAEESRAGTSAQGGPE